MRGDARVRRVGRWRLGVSLMAVGLVPLASCGADAAPVIGAAIAGDGRAMVSWEPPIGDSALTLTAYVVPVTPSAGAEPPTTRCLRI